MTVMFKTACPLHLKTLATIKRFYIYIYILSIKCAGVGQKYATYNMNYANIHTNNYINMPFTNVNMQHVEMSTCNMLT